MWDMKTGRSRGYGFVSYRERHEADKAIAAMDGEWLGSRAIRCNWANQKGQTAGQQPVSMVTSIPTYQVRPGFSQQAYEAILAQTPSWQTTCYIGNIAPSTTEQDIVPLFSQQGLILEKRFQSDRGFAFLKMDTHEHAASAIALLNGYIINDRPIKCSVCPADLTL